MENLVTPSWEEVKELLPETTSLYYVDYNESLDEHLDLLESCIQDQSYESLYDAINDWYEESPFYAFEYLDKELLSDIENKFGVEPSEAEEIFEEWRDHIRDEYYNRDDSDVLKDLLRNTGELVMFFDTGYEVEDGSWSWSEAKVRHERICIKKHLGIMGQTDEKDDREIDLMIQQASYGGQLVIYFNAKLDEVICGDDKPRNIRFNKPHLAIIDQYNGSGDNCQIGCLDVLLPFVPERLNLETAKYNYTYSVCGMSSDWCSGTGFDIELRDEPLPEVEKSTIQIQKEQDAKYEEVYRNGSCSFGDMDYRRHRNTTYINNFPCGNKCMDCGTFWID